MNTETEKQRVLDAFEGLYKTIPGGISGKEAQLLLRIALELVAHDLPCPSVCSSFSLHKNNSVYISFFTPKGFGPDLGVHIFEGQGSVSVLAADVRFEFPFDSDDADFEKFIVRVVDLWKDAVESSHHIEQQMGRIVGRSLLLTEEQKNGLTTSGRIPACIKEEP